MIIHKKKCSSCGVRNVRLMTASKIIDKGNNTIYYKYCRKCQRERRYKYYHANPENKIIIMKATMRGYAKRFGFKLIPKN